MDLRLFNNQINNGILILDPRTKIIILAILSFLVFANAPVYVTFILVSIPFFCLLLSNHSKIAIAYILIYILSTLLMIYVVPITSGILTFLIVAFINVSSRMLPIFIMAVYTVITTKVSEFVAALERNNIPKSIIIPFSVIFRYVPTLFDEIKSINDAMKMKGIGLNFNSLKSPLVLLEYFFVPILISAVKTSDELSAASLTRGLSNPKKRTNICQVGFSTIDVLLILISLIGLFIYFFYEFGWI